MQGSTPLPDGKKPTKATRPLSAVAPAPVQLSDIGDLPRAAAESKDRASRESTTPSDEIDVSVQAVSGKYLELEKQGKLEELLRLEQKREELQYDLAHTNAELSQINNQRWLLDFYFRARKRNECFGAKLERKAAQLEKRKARVSSELADIEGRISRIEPLLLQVQLPEYPEISSLVGKAPLRSRIDDPYAAVRDLMIKHLSDKEDSNEKICIELDAQLARRGDSPMGIPDEWVDKFGPDWQKKHGWNFYLAAYKDSRTKSRMQAIISKAKSRW